MERPYIICHMLTSLDGKIIGDYLKTERVTYFTDEYEEIHERYGSKAWICGRITMEEHFTFGHQVDLKKEDNIPAIPRTDYVANNDAESYAVAVDPLGKLGWTENSIKPWNENRSEDHIIEVLTEQVSDAYLAHLKKTGISYIFGGKERINFTTVVQKLKKLFSIDNLMLEGGGGLNGSFLNERLIDELSLILVPIADGASNSVTLFESSSSLNKQHPENFYLKEVEKLDDGGLWIKYLTKP
ncbi:Pyrimidine reductase, riboflavin biosynthesis [Paenibacillus sophorae]|uniref:Pyrimidine reductase, riboflavin biosynthesis n=1 Tax=Paenibacillus sophorae TaxID=1333845 RepID=A0A1H8W2F5_9BACL|nr:RibD family protein [Paenibacillus sophorae]QWU13763.1 RibD family protein [Paenibacillus sophorae]SEP21822.1 Pyrimidine reductase, riboflavin biosynthesis [Paenibacillus sophorae]